MLATGHCAFDASRASDTNSRLTKAQLVYNLRLPFQPPSSSPPAPVPRPPCFPLALVTSPQPTNPEVSPRPEPTAHLGLLLCLGIIEGAANQTLGGVHSVGRVGDSLSDKGQAIWVCAGMIGVVMKEGVSRKGCADEVA